MALKSKVLTVANAVDLYVHLVADFEGGAGWAWSLDNIRFSDEKEGLLVNGPHGDDGEWACWDAVVTTTADGFEVTGYDGPSGGTGCTVIIAIPQRYVRRLVISDE